MYILLFPTKSEKEAGITSIIDLTVGHDGKLIKRPAQALEAEFLIVVVPVRIRVIADGRALFDPRACGVDGGGNGGGAVLVRVADG